MKTTRIFSRSVATLLALSPLAARAAVDTLTGTGGATQPGVSWAPTAAGGGTIGVWSLGAIPGTGDNAIIAATGLIDIRGSAPVWPTHATEIQDLTFNSTAAVTLNNNSSSQDMLLILNGGRGAGVPLLSTVGDFAYILQGPGSNATAHPLSLQLKASGDISVAANVLTVSAVLAESGGARSIKKTGAGRLTLGGANTFTGGTTVSAGILEVTVNGALGTGPAVVNGGTLEVNLASATLGVSALTVNAGGQIATRGAVTLNNALTLNGGTLATRTADTGTYAGAINVTGSSFVNLRSYTTPTSDLNVNITGLLSGSGALTINGNATNATSGKALILKNTGNTYSGTFSISAGQTLRSAPAVSGSTLGTGAVSLNGGTLQIRDDGAGSGGTFAFNNNVTVAASGTIDVDRIASGLSNTYQFGTLNFAAGQTLTTTGANLYAVRFGGATTLAAGAIFNPTTAPTVLAGIVNGAADLTTAGSGVLQLNAANTYTGHTNVNGGTLNLVGSIASSPGIHVAAGATLDVSTTAGGFILGGAQTLTGAGTVTGPVTVGNGGTIQPGDTAGAGTLSMAALTFGTGAGQTAAVRFINAATPGTLNVTGSNALVAGGGANSVSINLPGAAPAVGSYTLIDYAGTLGGAGFGGFKLGTVPNRLVANLVHNLANTSIDLQVSGIDFPIWKGAPSTQWSTAALGNWVLNSNNATATDFLVNDSVTFSDFATVTTVDVSSADVAPAAVLFSNATKDYVLTGSKAIVGSTTFTVSGSGKVTISNTNSFTTAPALNAGTVSVAAVANSGVNSPLGAGPGMVFGGGALEFTGASGSTDRTVTLNTPGGTVKTATPLTFAGVVSGPGALTKTGNGTLILSGANTYGDTAISGGTLQVGAGGSIGTLGAGPVTNDSALIFNRTDVALSVGNVIAGIGTVTNAGTGTVTLSGTVDNTYSGLTTVSAGTLLAGKTAGVIAIPGNLVIAAGAIFRLATSDQIADTASVTINGGTFGDPANLVPAAGGPIDTVANVTLNGGSFGSNRNLAGFSVTNQLSVTGGGLAVVQRGGVINAARVAVSVSTVNLDGGSGTAANESRLNVGPGGLGLNGGTINFNTGSVTAGSVGSILALGGDVTSTGTSTLARLNPAFSTATVDLGGATRIMNVSGTLTIGTGAAPITITNGALTKTGAGTLNLTGPQTYATLRTEGGVTHLYSALGTGASTLEAGAATSVHASQTLAALTIAPGAEVTFDSAVSFAGEPEKFAAPALVPEPGSAVLLLAGLATLGLRRRAK